MAGLSGRTTPEVIDRLKRIEDLGYEEFSFWIDSGMNTERKKASLARFIDEVVSAFSGENRWPLSGVLHLHKVPALSCHRKTDHENPRTAVHRHRLV
ncbi:hypothetical protein [Nisaea nitritireducens]|uniref:hypothetical protein n=1 Tax=Nisaea nitritireducens TaxID=568392 RepID=UPI001D0047EF|nr:hypothetical protein [Nisaea nitritireducens]